MTYQSSFLLTFFGFSLLVYLLIQFFRFIFKSHPNRQKLSITMALLYISLNILIYEGIKNLLVQKLSSSMEVVLMSYPGVYLGCILGILLYLLPQIMDEIDFKIAKSKKPNKAIIVTYQKHASAIIPSFITNPKFENTALMGIIFYDTNYQLRHIEPHKIKVLGTIKNFTQIMKKHLINQVYICNAFENQYWAISIQNHCLANDIKCQYLYTNNDFYKLKENKNFHPVDEDQKIDILEFGKFDKNSPGKSNKKFKKI
jgi:hypothetical protein